MKNSIIAAAPVRRQDVLVSRPPRPQDPAAMWRVWLERTMPMRTREPQHQPLEAGEEQQASAYYYYWRGSWAKMPGKRAG